MHNLLIEEQIQERQHRQALIALRFTERNNWVLVAETEIPQRPPPHHARDVYESMEAKEWEGICLFARGTKHPCLAQAVWKDGWWECCDLHCRRRDRVTSLLEP